MLILLTHANHLFSDRKQLEKMQPYPPLQTLVAAATLREAGHEVEFFDTTFDRNIRPVIERLRPDVVAVCEDNFNFLTKMCLLENRRFALEIAESAREHGALPVVNSSDATDHPREYLSAGFQAAILGELEASLLDVCRGGPSQTPGTATWDSHRRAVAHHGLRPPIRDLDTLPAPAWDLLDVEPYRAAWLAAHGYFSMNLVASRGCPYRCNWCAKPLYGSSYRHYSPDRIASEMEGIERRFRPDHLWFADDIFGLSSKWTAEFAECVERRNARIDFKIQSRCDLMTRPTVDALQRAGCVEVWMGVESGSQRVLDAMEKDIRVEQIYAARENLRRHGLRACYFVQFGYRGEQWEDIEQTIQVIRETRPHDVGISVSYPLPNTRFHQIVQAQLGSTANWSESGDLAMLYSGSFPSEFYRALADALHLEVRSGASEDDVRLAWGKVEQLRCACC